MTDVMARLTKEDEHGLSHRVFYHKNGYSLIFPTGYKGRNL